MVGVLSLRDISKINQIKMEGVDIVNSTSRSTNWSRGLSPFYLGPVYLYNGNIAQNVENAWQFSKVYSCHTDVKGNPTEEYWIWAKEGWSKKEAIRYPFGKDKKPEYSLWDGKKLSYIEARKVIYIPLYIKAVVPSEAFKKLKAIHQNKRKLYLLDFDGYDYLANGDTLKDVLENPNKKMGHAFVLAMLLTLPKNEILNLINQE